ncbi:MAG: HEAT repeat domain-containing protein [Elusimicrobia bacterium]|nr:HEAT repeat domain-containing protein [Elusimicrobiota bacterium]
MENEKSIIKHYHFLQIVAEWGKILAWILLIFSAISALIYISALLDTNSSFLGWLPVIIAMIFALIFFIILNAISESLIALRNIAIHINQIRNKIVPKELWKISETISEDVVVDANRDISETTAHGASVENINRLMKIAENIHEPDIIRLKVIEKLGGIKDSKVVDTLITLLNDSNADIRWQSANSLGLIKDKKAVKPLIKALQDNDRYVRLHAIQSLGKINDPNVVRPTLLYI